ncbi:hypothetical protein FYZ48_07045 [Gimesia chilikensis]|uniref:hypothetical protein n=1 Tax=Gimesia chilikensis TaxID=2605989 RepID=UPI0011F073A4|nr:hypothetical protein [Gimesia chilikensis]KAA0141022.1 hypothetical protein FYZ48_07045 [Gimesia chilikensis]
MRSIADVEAELTAFEIPIDEVEFYNHQSFITAEQHNPFLLETYCEYVASQKYSQEYLERSRRVVPLVADYLYGELKQDGKLGACLDFVQSAMKIYERLGIWCSTMAGSLTIEFDPATKQQPRYWAHFFDAPEGSNAAGHAWLMVPPFHVIDMTIGLQQNTADIQQYLPEFVLEETVGPVAGVALEDILDQDLMTQARMARSPVPTIHQLMKLHPNIARMLTKFPPFSVKCEQATLKYFPCRTGALIEKFEDVKTHCFSGQTVPELFTAMMDRLGDDLA